MNTENKIDATTIDEKLPHEQEHLEALQRMRALDAYYVWSLNLVKPWIGKRILDAGCGIGNGTALLAPTAELVLAADLSPQNVEELQDRFREQPQVRPIQLDLDADFSHLAEHQLDTIVCLDVLEHIEQDGVLLQRFYDVMQPGGHLLIKVPAVKWLYGSVDTASGHFRRYTRGELREKAQQVGWEPVSVRWMNIFGVLPYFVKSRIQKKDANLSRTFSPWQLRLIQRSMPWLRRVDRWLGPPIGQSAILVARKPGS